MSKHRTCIGPGSRPNTKRKTVERNQVAALLAAGHTSAEVQQMTGASRAMVRRVRLEGSHYQTATPRRCPTCGAKITTADCLACSATRAMACVR